MSYRLFLYLNFDEILMKISSKFSKIFDFFGQKRRFSPGAEKSIFFSKNATSKKWWNSCQIFARAAGQLVQKSSFFAIFGLFFAFPYKVREFLIFLENRTYYPLWTIFWWFFGSSSSSSLKTQKIIKKSFRMKIQNFSLSSQILTSNFLLIKFYFFNVFSCFLQNSIKI